MPGNILQKYGSSGQAITLTLAGLADSATVGRASTVISNVTDLFIDALVFLNIKTGGTSAGDKAVYVYAYGSVNGGTDYTDGVTGTDAGFTMPDPPNLRLIGVISTPAITTTYKGGPFSVASAFGGVLPERWGLFLRNKSGGALDATEGNHLKVYQGIAGSYT
jgi:hypothetical protein